MNRAMTFIRLLLATAIFGAAVEPAAAGVKTGADFLKLPIGARAASLGHAYNALASGAEALNWNPAGIVNGPAKNSVLFSFTHQQLLLENSLDNAAFVFPSDDFAFGLNVARLSYPKQETREDTRAKKGNFSASDLSAGVSFAFRFEQAAIGSQLKFIRQDLAGSVAEGFALDLGARYERAGSPLSFGASMQNFGARMEFVREKFHLPLRLSAGAAYRIKSPLTLTLDVHSFPREHRSGVSLGTEFNAAESVSIRAGYLARLTSAVTNNQRHETNRGNIGRIDGLTGGVGIRLKRATLDYAFTPFGELGMTHAITLGTSFGQLTAKDRKRKTRKKQTTPPPADDRRILILEPENGDDWLTTPDR